MVFQNFEGVNGMLSQMFAFFVEFFSYIRSFFTGSEEDAEAAE